MIGGLIARWSNNSLLKDMSGFVKNLSVMDSDEIALVVAFATHWRHVYAERESVDLLNCLIIQQVDPLFVISVGNVIKEAQRRTAFQDAAGLMVWAHSLRAGNTFELRSMARQMWAQLARGFASAPSAAAEHDEMFGKILNVSGCNAFPIGLTPEPN